MFNFSSKGNTGMFGGGQPTLPPPQRAAGANLTVQDVTRINPVDGERYGVGYWFEYAQTLKEGVKGLIDDRDTIQRIALERRAVDTGLRAVIRDLLKELAIKDPTNRMLDKKVRDRIFSEYENHEMEKILKSFDMLKWDPRERPDENQTE